MVALLWGKHIAGPMAAILAIILPLIGLGAGSSRTVAIWLGVAPLLLAVLLIWPAQYEAWKQERDAKQKALTPSIEGEYFEVRLVQNSNGIISLIAYLCARNVTTSLKSVRVKTKDLSGKEKTVDSAPPVRYPAEPFVLEMNIGRTQTFMVVLGSDTIPFMETMGVFAVDAFGIEHELKPREPQPIPFWDKKGL